VVSYNKALKGVDIIGVPSDLGASIVGSNEGPFAIRNCGLFSSLKYLAKDVADRGNIAVSLREEIYAEMERHHPQIFVHGDRMFSTHSPGFEVVKTYLDKMFAALAREVVACLQSQRLPLILGGDHSLSMGSLRGVYEVIQQRSQRLGVMWFDAHLDGHDSQSSISGNLHGMPLGALLYGDPLLGIKPLCDPQDVVIIGARSVDRGERERMEDLGVHIYGLDALSSSGGLDAVIATLKKDFFTKVDAVHVSFDLDVCDPQLAPGVSTPELAGLFERDIYRLMRMVALSEKLISFEMVELNPRFDKDRQTAKWACEVILWALGSGV